MRETFLLKNLLRLVSFFIWINSFFYFPIVFFRFSWRLRFFSLDLQEEKVKHTTRNIHKIYKNIINYNNWSFIFYYTLFKL